MSLSAWEQQILDSIADGLTVSDPELAALLSAFTRLASGEDMPDREKVLAGSRRAVWRLRRARWRSRSRRAARRLVWERTFLLWLLTTAVLIAAAVTAGALSLGANGDGGTCTATVALVCVGPAPGHSPDSHSDPAASQAPAGGQ